MRLLHQIIQEESHEYVQNIDEIFIKENSML